MSLQVACRLPFSFPVPSSPQAVPFMDLLPLQPFRASPFPLSPSTCTLYLLAGLIYQVLTHPTPSSFPRLVCRSVGSIIRRRDGTIPRGVSTPPSSAKAAPNGEQKATQTETYPGHVLSFDGAGSGSRSIAKFDVPGETTSQLTVSAWWIPPSCYCCLSSYLTLSPHRFTLFVIRFNLPNPCPSPLPSAPSPYFPLQQASRISDSLNRCSPFLSHRSSARVPPPSSSRHGPSPPSSCRPLPPPASHRGPLCLPLPHRRDSDAPPPSHFFTSRTHCLPLSLPFLS